MKTTRIPATVKEKKFMELIKSMPCVECQEVDKILKFGVECHHIVAGYRLGNMFCLPLCYEHHRGEKGFSGYKTVWKPTEKETRLEKQLRYLKITYRKMGLNPPEYNPKKANTSFYNKYGDDK